MDTEVIVEEPEEKWFILSKEEVEEKLSTMRNIFFCFFFYRIILYIDKNLFWSKQYY